jgi:hypothetical protein
VVEANGRENPAAAPLRAFAAAHHLLVEAAPPLEVDPERYWRDAQRGFADLWCEFNAEA